MNPRLGPALMTVGGSSLETVATVNVLREMVNTPRAAHPVTSFIHREFL